MTPIETVSDLIDRLAEYPGDTPIRVQARAGQSRRSVRNVEPAAGELGAVVVCGW